MLSKFLLFDLSFIMSSCSEQLCFDEPQRSLGGAASLEGMGLFTGSQGRVRLCSAPEGFGVVFQRMDLPGQPLFPVHIKNACNMSRRSTTLGSDPGQQVRTVEHLLSAINAFGLDNVLVEMDGPEVPICDGSALPFVALIEEAGVVTQDAKKKVHHLKEPVYWSKEDVHLVALPSEEFRVSYALSFSEDELLGAQFCTVIVNEQTYKKEIAPARTFALYDEVVLLAERGEIKGSLDNGVVIKDGAVLNPGGLRYRNEMARHKILDIIGDLSLVAHPFRAHVVAICSGHSSNRSFAQVLLDCFVKEPR